MQRSRATTGAARRGFAARAAPSSAGSGEWDLEGLNVHCLGSLVAGLGVIGDPGALCEGAKALGCNRRVMDEEVLAGFIGGDEAKPLVVVEPLHGSSCHGDTSERVLCCPRRYLR